MDTDVVADVEVEGPMVPDQLNVYLWRRGFHLFFPMRGKDHWRLVGIRPPHPRVKDDLRFEEVIRAVRQEAGAELARFGIPRPSFYLLRPDGHVGLAGARLRPEAAARYVRERPHPGVRGEAISAAQPLRGEA